MKDTFSFCRFRFFGLIAAVVFSILSFGQITAHAATDTARVVKYAQNDIVPIRAKLRYSTLIILPEKEEFSTSQPATKNSGSSTARITSATSIRHRPEFQQPESNHGERPRYSFLLSEISSDPNADPDLKVVIEPKEESGIGTGAFAQGYVPATEAEAYKREIQTIRDQANAQVQTAQTSAQQQIQKFRSEYSTKLQFDYQFDTKGAGKPFLVSAIYHDDTFTYIKCAASEKPADLRNQRRQTESHQLRTPERRLHRPENRGHRLSGHRQEETRLFPPPVRSDPQNTFRRMRGAHDRIS